MFVPLLLRNSCYFPIAVLLFAPARAVAQGGPQIDGSATIRPPENLFDGHSVSRKLEGVRAQLAQHPQQDEIRAGLLTDVATLQSRLGFLREAKESSRAVLSMAVDLCPEYSGVNHFVLANAFNLEGSGTEAEREYLE